MSPLEKVHWLYIVLLPQNVEIYLLEVQRAGSCQRQKIAVKLKYQSKEKVFSGLSSVHAIGSFSGSITTRLVETQINFH